MTAIATFVTPEMFKMHIEPHLSKAKRGYACKVSLEKIFNAILYKLYTGCQWRMLNLDAVMSNLLTWQAIYWHYRKWSRDGSLEKVWKNSLIELKKKKIFLNWNWTVVIA